MSAVKRSIVFGTVVWAAFQFHTVVSVKMTPDSNSGITSWHFHDERTIKLHQPTMFSVFSNWLLLLLLSYPLISSFSVFLHIEQMLRPEGQSDNFFVPLLWTYSFKIVAAFWSWNQRMMMFVLFKIHLEIVLFHLDLNDFLSKYMNIL